MKRLLVGVVVGLLVVPAAEARPYSETLRVPDVERRTLKPRTSCSPTVVNVWVYRQGKRVGQMVFNENAPGCGSARFHGYGVAVTIRVAHHRLRIKVANANATTRTIRFVWKPGR